MRPIANMGETVTQPLLFTPIRLRDVTLKNRVVVAPMHQYAAKKGYATDWHLMNAGRYAAGGAGLLATSGPGTTTIFRASPAV